jgi:hypothetical protein
LQQNRTQQAEISPRFDRKRNKKKKKKTNPDLKYNQKKKRMNILKTKKARTHTL